MKKIVLGLFLGILLSFFQVIYPMISDGVVLASNKHLQLGKQNEDRRGQLVESCVLAKAKFNASLNSFRINEDVIARVGEKGYIYGKVFLIKGIVPCRLSIDFGDCGARDIPRAQVGKLQN